MSFSSSCLVLSARLAALVKRGGGMLLNCKLNLQQQPKSSHSTISLENSFSMGGEEDAKQFAIVFFYVLFAACFLITVALQHRGWAGKAIRVFVFISVHLNREHIILHLRVCKSSPMSVSACVCVSMRESERTREREGYIGGREKERERERITE